MHHDCKIPHEQREIKPAGKRATQETMEPVGGGRKPFCSASEPAIGAAGKAEEDEEGDSGGPARRRDELKNYPSLLRWGLPDRSVRRKQTQCQEKVSIRAEGPTGASRTQSLPGTSILGRPIKMLGSFVSFLFVFDRFFFTFYLYLF